MRNEKTVAKITIQDIADESDYSPATFYRHFSDKFDLIASAFKNILEQHKKENSLLKGVLI
ncbi:MAG: TetR/AcrR family transcriptional regulator [Sharpea porci]